MIATRRFLLIGHVGTCKTCLTANTLFSTTLIGATDVASSDCSVDVVTESYANTNNYCEPYVYYDYEKWSKIGKVKEMKAGWLKPHKRLRPFENNQIINYNLPRGRLREKKQLAA